MGGVKDTEVVTARHELCAVPSSESEHEATQAARYCVSTYMCAASDLAVGEADCHHRHDLDVFIRDMAESATALSRAYNPNAHGMAPHSTSDARSLPHVK